MTGKLEVIDSSVGLVPRNALVLIRVQPKSSAKQFGGKRRSQSFASVAFNDCTGGVIARVEQPQRSIQLLSLD